MIDRGIGGRRVRMTCGALIASVIAMSLPMTAVAQSTSSPDRSVPRLAAGTALLQRYRSSHSLDDLRAAATQFSSATDFSTMNPDDRVTRRRAVTAGLAEVLHELQSLSDPAFDPNDPKNYPLLCVTPPREPARQLPACADPKDIPDPELRARYVAAIEANDAKRRRFEAQDQIRRVRELTTAQLQAVLRLYRSQHTPPDATALEAILRRASLSDAQRAKFEPLL